MRFPEKMKVKPSGHGNRRMPLLFIKQGHSEIVKGAHAIGLGDFASFFLVVYLSHSLPGPR